MLTGAGSVVTHLRQQMQNGRTEQKSQRLVGRQDDMEVSRHPYTTLTRLNVQQTDADADDTSKPRHKNVTFFLWHCNLPNSSTNLTMEQQEMKELEHVRDSMLASAELQCHEMTVLEALTSLNIQFKLVEHLYRIIMTYQHDQTLLHPTLNPDEGSYTMSHTGNHVTSLPQQEPAPRRTEQASSDVRLKRHRGKNVWPC